MIIIVYKGAQNPILIIKAPNPYSNYLKPLGVPEAQAILREFLRNLDGRAAGRSELWFPRGPEVWVGGFGFRGLGVLEFKLRGLGVLEFRA